MAKLVFQACMSSGQLVALYHGDLTEEKVDAIVNAANDHLAHGGGLAAAIVRRGGADIQRESYAWIQAHGRAGHTQPALTGAGRLACKVIIHAVGPVWGSGDEDRKLGQAYAGALQLAHAQGLTSIAFPSLSTGIFGFPVERAAPLAVQTVIDFCQAQPASPVREIRFTIIDAPTVEVFQRELQHRLGTAAGQG